MENSRLKPSARLKSCAFLSSMMKFHIIFPHHSLFSANVNHSSFGVFTVYMVITH